MTTRILVVCPYESLSPLITSVAREYPNIHVDTILGDISDVSSWWNYVDMIQDNYHFIISRGGTMSFLEKNLHVPVLELKSSVFDMMRIVSMIRDYPGKCAVVGSQVSNEFSGVICELMNAPIDTFAFDGDQNTIEGIRALQAQGYSLIISGVRGNRAAQALGLNSILITSGEEAIKSIFDEAVRFHRVIEKTALENEILRELIHSRNSYHAILDREGNLIYQDQKFFSVPLELLQKKKEMVFHYGELTTYIRINKNTYHFHGSLAESGNSQYAIIQISACHYLGNEQQTWISTYSASNMSHQPYSLLNGHSQRAMYLQEQIRRITATGNPVIIHGNYGVGKSAILNQLHSFSANNQNDLIVINVANGNKRLWKTLLEDPDSPLNQPRFNICFQNFNEIPSYALTSLQDFISGLTFTANKKLYFMWTDTDSKAYIENTLMRYLIEEKGALSIYVPSLHECSEDLPDLTRIALTERNAHFGKHVFSVEKDALRMIQDYPWEQNFIQFRQFINNIIMLTEGSTVTSQLVSEVLDNLSVRQPSISSQSGIDLTGTLEEITQSVIQHVLKEENYNYSRTAKRLGISRTSLWRKLN